MAWTTPSTWVAGNVLSAAGLNEQLRDNMTYLHTGKPLSQLIVTAGDYTSANNGLIDVDATNLSITLSSTTGRVLVSAMAAVSSNSGHNVGLAITLDGSAYVIGVAYADLTVETITLFSFLAVSVGSHTFRLQWNPGGTSSTLSATAGQPTYLGVCEI